MASTLSTGSPKLGRKATPAIIVLDQGSDGGKTPTNEPKASASNSTRGPGPLQSSKLSNLQPKSTEKLQDTANSQAEDTSRMEEILARLRHNDSRKTTPTYPQPPVSTIAEDKKSLEKLLTGLNGSRKVLKEQAQEVKDESDSDAVNTEDRSSVSDLFTPATDTFEIMSREDAREAKAASAAEAAEIQRVKRELAAAQAKITRQEQELAESRNLKHTMEQAMGPPSEVDFGNHHDISEQTIGHLQSAFNASARPFTSRTDQWHPQEDSRSDNSDGLPGSNFNRGRNTWNGRAQQPYAGNFNAPAPTMPVYNQARPYPGSNGSWNNSFGNQGFQSQGPQGSFTQNPRTFSGSSSQSFAFDSRMFHDAVPSNANIGVRRNMGQFNRSSGSALSDHSSAFGSYTAGMPQLNGVQLSPVGVPGPYGYQPRPIGAPLSPNQPSEPDFASTSFTTISGGPWSPTLSAMGGSTYVTPLEPMNYRRLLDKSVSCDWKYIVDKIVCSNDQQASIFLQQKLKVGTAEQKFEIVEAIVNQAYPLMINRFGNFLVQRCFEHGTPDQVVAIASAIHGNVLSLSMDAFGCHVIQKAFDSVPEQHKADMVRELLRRIPDTVIHRYACHVWQKLFELRWSGEPPQIMLKVNEALRGMWHEVALGETGSLVVQNIFENCVEEEKRPAIEEVIASIDLIAHGQFGNWCIQHLCEHGSPPDKRRVIDHILLNSYSYSIDQFASKVVEKCLKIGGVEFLDRYLGVITTAHPDRPRIPLIDIAGDQYGNYLIQWILMNTHHHQREQVANHIRKHMVSLRGSKFGSRVAMLCCNPSQLTRPGPGAIVNPYGAPGQPRGWSRPQYR